MNLELRVRTELQWTVNGHESWYDYYRYLNIVGGFYSGSPSPSYHRCSSYDGLTMEPRRTLSLHDIQCPLICRDSLGHHTAALTVTLGKRSPESLLLSGLLLLAVIFVLTHISPSFLRQPA